MAEGGQPLHFGELLVGGVLLTMGISGASVREVLAGKGGTIRPLKAGHGSSAEGGVPHNTAFELPGGAGALGASGYAYPFGAGWTEERTDQGVDFAPSHTGAPIYSPGRARVIKIGAPGWPSGEKGVLLHLLDGPLAGRNIFIYEAIHPTVALNQVVEAGQQVGYGVFGETGIEIGFADRTGTPLSHAEYTEGKETVWGKKMREWLRRLRTEPKNLAKHLGGEAAHTLGWKGTVRA